MLTFRGIVRNVFFVPLVLYTAHIHTTARRELSNRFTAIISKMVVFDTILPSWDAVWRRKNHVYWCCWDPWALVPYATSSIIYYSTIPISTLHAPIHKYIQLEQCRVNSRCKGTAPQTLCIGKWTSWDSTCSTCGPSSMGEMSYLDSNSHRLVTVKT